MPRTQQDGTIRDMVVNLSLDRRCNNRFRGLAGRRIRCPSGRGCVPLRGGSHRDAGRRHCGAMGRGRRGAEERSAECRQDRVGEVRQARAGRGGVGRSAHGRDDLHGSRRRVRPHRAPLRPLARAPSRARQQAARRPDHPGGVVRHRAPGPDRALYPEGRGQARSRLDLLGRQPAGGTRHRGFPAVSAARQGHRDRHRRRAGQRRGDDDGRRPHRSSPAARPERGDQEHRRARRRCHEHRSCPTRRIARPTCWSWAVTAIRGCENSSSAAPRAAFLPP